MDVWVKESAVCGEVMTYWCVQVALAALRHARSSFGLSVQAHELEEALHFAFSAPRPEGQEGRGAEAWALKARGAQ